MVKMGKAKLAGWVLLVSSVFLVLLLGYIYQFKANRFRKINSSSLYDLSCSPSSLQAYCEQNSTVIAFNQSLDSDLEQAAVELPQGKRLYFDQGQRKELKLETRCFLEQNQTSLSLTWCCQRDQGSGCYRINLDQLITFYGAKESGRRMEKESEPNSVGFENESRPVYPEHPTLEDCEQFEEESISFSFCYADLAEIKRNLSYCHEIDDDEIKNFCRARVELNKTVCARIQDQALAESCIKSIELKRNWSNGGGSE